MMKGMMRCTGGSSTYPFNSDGSTDEVSVDPASDGSRSFRPIEMLTRRKLREFPTTNRT